MQGPLFVLAGAQAAGKSTLRPQLDRLARGPIVMEMDELHELLEGPKDEAAWAEYDRIWVRLIEMVRRAGHPVIFLCPTPAPDTFAASDAAFEPPVSWARLDCSDSVRRARLRERGWSSTQIADFIDDPGHDQIRVLIPLEFRTDDTAPDALAAEVLAWVATSSPRSCRAH